MPVIGGDKICEISNLIIAYIAVHYSADFLVTFEIMCCYVLRKAM